MAIFTKHPAPWQVKEEDGQCWGIYDGLGKRVVETDCGFYPPDLDTAHLICIAVNSYLSQGPDV